MLCSLLVIRRVEVMSLLLGNRREAVKGALMYSLSSIYVSGILVLSYGLDSR
jgi:hypothetical protein